jgi:hypothetical protein
MFVRHRRLLGLTVVTLSGGLLLLAGLPGHAQQPSPAVPAARHTAPATAAVGRATDVPIQFDLPPGYTLTGFPRLRVLDTRGAIVELRPCYITAKPPAGRGHRSLNSHRYRPGVYMLRVEYSFKDAAGKSGTAVSPFTTLTVPAR